MPFDRRTFSDGDLTLHYEVFGTGRHTVVYLHGLLLDSHVNRRLAADLAAGGRRVVLLDLPGHGGSDKPRRAAAHRMDAYARNVVHLLDELGVERAVVGGMSLGADVTLLLAQMAPERLAGMVLEMPVLEQATPVAAMVFVPLLTLAHYAAPAMRRLTGLVRRIPRHQFGPLDQFAGPLYLDPDEMVAVLHGVLVGPVAPTAEERARIDVPALVVGHRSDRLHPFGDASALVSQLPDARLLEAHTIFELRFTPERLTAAIADFCDQAFAPRARRHRAPGA